MGEGEALRLEAPGDRHEVEGADCEHDDCEVEVAGQVNRPPAHGQGRCREHGDLAGGEVVDPEVGGAEDVADADEQRDDQHDVGEADLHEHLGVLVRVLVGHDILSFYKEPFSGLMAWKATEH